MTREIREPSGCYTGELNIDQLKAVRGGMKWDHNFNNKEVIDARGGSFTILGETITYDPSGKVTSVSRT